MAKGAAFLGCDSSGRLCQNAPAMATAPRRLSRLRLAEFGDGDQRSGHDPLHEVRLGQLQRDQPTQHVEQVQQVLGVFGKPPSGWIFSSGEAAACRRSAAWCDRGVVAEPLVGDLLPEIS